MGSPLTPVQNSKHVGSVTMQHGDRTSDDRVNLGGERQHHPRLFARGEVLHEIDELFRRGATSVLVTGTPGVGKSAILASYLQRVASACEVERVRGVIAGASRYLARWAEQVERNVRGEERWVVASHFLRTSALDRPEIVARSLATQLEDRFIDMRDEHARPERRLVDLVERISMRVLEPESLRLLLVIDDLDEAEDENGYSELARLLPAPLPPRVVLLASSRPTTNLNWFMRYAPAHVDLDAPRWIPSNHAACRAFWDGVVGELQLPAYVADQAVQRAQGNMLYSVELAEWLRRLPPERRLVDPLPRTLRDVFVRLWRHVNCLPAEPEALVKRSLALLCAAPSPLPLSYIAAHTGWSGRLHPATFLRVTRPFLQRFSAPGAEDTFCPFHDELRTLITEQLAAEAAAARPATYHAGVTPVAVYPPPSAPSPTPPPSAPTAPLPPSALTSLAPPSAPAARNQGGTLVMRAVELVQQPAPQQVTAVRSERAHARGDDAERTADEEAERAMAAAEAQVLGLVAARHAFLVGVGRYDDRSIGNLRFCVNDVVALGNALKNELGYTTVKVMHDDVEDDTMLPLRNRVLQELSLLASGLHPNDLLLVHFSCHGALHKGKPVLLFRDTGKQVLSETCLSVNRIKKILLESPARRKILFLDACHAGVDLGRALDGPSLDPAFVHDAFELAEGLAVLSGSTSQQIAMERPEAKLGVFTSFVLEGLRGAADRAGRKGFVTVDDLNHYVTCGVQQWSREQSLSLQTPTARIEGTGSMILADFRERNA
ncbi:caspase family protein [Sorangium sp. So ce448]|uniref:caspase family protein n=1 Tax=Sorangium sp. So ce448 TaxID=3133314 RepID=UPI003F601DCE